MSDKLKVDRGHRKATVTRLLGNLECLMAEDVAADVVAAKLKDVKAAFGDLEVAHDAYTDSLEAEADILKSEAWYNSAQQNYVTRVKSANDWIKSKRVNSDNANVSGASASSTRTGCSTSKAGSDPVSQIDIALPSISSGEKAELLIGMDNSHLLMPLEVRSDENAARAPYATRLVFGWALNGPVEGCNDSHVRGVSSFHITLEEQVGNMWEFDFVM